MRKFNFLKISTIIFILLSNYTILAQNIISINDTLVEPSSYFWLDVNLENSSGLIGFQFDIILPNEIIYLDSIVLGSRYTDHSVSSTHIENNEIRILSFSLSNSIIIDSTGSLIRLFCQSGQDDGEFTISLSNVVLVGSSGINVLDSVKNGAIIIQTPVNIQSYNNSPKSNSQSKIYVYPNPFNNSTIINYFANTLLPFELTTFSIDGRELNKKEIIPRNIGRNEEIINMQSFASGMYILKLQNNERISTTKMLLLK